MGELIEKLSLSFNNHTGLLLDGIWKQYVNEIGTDLIILCEDGDLVKVHRWIIEIFAPHLLELSQPNSNRLNIKKDILKLIIEFLYKGKVDVTEFECEKLRQASELLMLSHLLEVVHSSNAEQAICDPNVGLEVEICDQEKISNGSYWTHEEDQSTSFDNSSNLGMVVDKGDNEAELMEIRNYSDEDVNKCGAVIDSGIVMEKLVEAEATDEVEIVHLESNQMQSLPEDVIQQTEPQNSISVNQLNNFPNDIQPPQFPAEFLQSLSNEMELQKEMMLMQSESEEVATEQSIINTEELRKNAKDSDQCQESTLEALQLQGIAREAIILLGLSKETAPQPKFAKRTVELQGIAKEAIKLLGLENQSASQQSKRSGKSKILVMKTATTRVQTYKPTENDANCENLNFKSIKRRQLSELKMRCVKCEFVGNDRYNFEQHIVIVHPELDNSKDRKQRRCTHCDFIAFHKQGLFVHLKAEHASIIEMKFECKQCEFVTEKKSLFVRHVRNEHSTDRPFRCDKCDYRGMTKTNLWMHQQIHSGKRYECETCGKKLNSQTSLTKHHKLHLDPVFTCPVCTYPYRDKGTLKRHLRQKHKVVDTMEEFQRGTLERIKCPLCDYSAMNDRFLEKHLAGQHQVDKQMNHIEPSISCPDCEFMCHIQSQLTNHQYTVHKKHRKKVQEKVICDDCGNCYSSKEHMKRHKKMMHNADAVMHMCHLCGFTTKTRGNLTQHLKRKHEDCI